MPTTRARAAKPPVATTGQASTEPSKTATAPAAPFPLAQYASVLGVRLTLLGFAPLYLPQTTRLFAPLSARTTDRPQSEFAEALTASPALTLGWISPGLVLLEVWWASWVRAWSFGRAGEGSGVETELDRARFDGLRFTRLKGATAFTLGATLAIYIVVVTFGAPFTTHILQTALLAFVVAVLTVFTPAFVLGPPSFAADTPSTVNRLTWTRLFAELSPRNAIERAMVYPAVGAFIGGWLGAIPIALDWDRPWQAWPLTPLFGSLGGYAVGAFSALALSTVGWLAAEDVRQSHPFKSKSS